ncbi:MAG: hypothetical protein AB1746_01165 [Candidatus Zixiibacteriota bacterium]
MQVTKTLAILFAVVLVVICFNAPVVNSWDGGSRDHPWDGDDGGDDGGDNAIIDTTSGGGVKVLYSLSPSGNQGGEVSGMGTFITAIHLLFVYHDMPGFYTEVLGAFGANADK